MWGRRKRGGDEGEGEHFYPLQHPKDRSILMIKMVGVNMIMIMKVSMTLMIVRKCVKQGRCRSVGHHTLPDVKQPEVAAWQVSSQNQHHQVKQVEMHVA